MYVLTAPHCFPHNSYLPYLRHYLPEILGVSISPEAVVHIVVPFKDPLTESARTISRWANGAFTSDRNLPIVHLLQRKSGGPSC